MKITTQELESSQVLLEIEVEPARMERALDQAYRRIANRLNVPGFRRGKAPRPLVERMVGRETLLEEALEQLVPAVYREAVDQAGLRPIEDPTLEVVETEPLRIKATVPVRPKVRLGDYRSLRRELVVPPVTEEQIQGVLEQLREAHAIWVPVERPVQWGDRVAIDVHGAAGAAVLVDRQDVEYEVRPDDPHPVPGFGEQLVGLRAGEEKAFTIRIPEDHSDRELAGKDVAFRVRLHWVKEKQLPELDDAFAASVGAFNTLADLRAHVERELRARAEAAARRELQEAVVEAVVGVASLELPPQAVEKQAERLRQRLISSLDKQGITVEQYRQLTQKSASDLDEELRAEARRDLTRAFVLDAVAEAEQIEVDPAEVEAEIRRVAGDGAQGARAAEAALARPAMRERVAVLLRERKAVERLVALATGQADQSPVAAQSAEPSAEGQASA
ncbi:MAG TPA: trigger factor [Chloroflexota bacterium]|nr:trigger factor [Chloroflexota bacterium]HZU04758.1 trigger factor [Chloroflexota bacterium]